MQQQQHQHQQHQASNFGRNPHFQYTLRYNQQVPYNPNQMGAGNFGGQQFQQQQQTIVNVPRLSAGSSCEQSKDAQPNLGTLNKKWAQIILAEFLGTALMMFIGCMANGDFRIVTAGFAVGLAVQVFGPISGAHINPSITLAAFVMGEIDYKSLPIYTIPQFLGALSGYGLLYEVTDITEPCCTAVNESLGVGYAVVVEIITTAALALTVCSLWDKRSNNASNSSLKVAVIIIGLILAAGNLTGASFNSARTLAPSIIHNKWENHWVYWVGPNVGGLVGGLIYRYLLLEREWQD